jgi:nonstructural protein NSm
MSFLCKSYPNRHPSDILNNMQYSLYVYWQRRNALSHKKIHRTFRDFTVFVSFRNINYTLREFNSFIVRLVINVGIETRIFWTVHSKAWILLIVVCSMLRHFILHVFINVRAIMAENCAILHINNLVLGYVLKNGSRFCFCSKTETWNM